MEKIIGSFGYYQKGNRYHWQINGAINTKMGFRSKAECDTWINEKRNQYGLDWTAGYLVKFKSEQTPWLLVDKRGKEIKC